MSTVIDGTIFAPFYTIATTTASINTVDGTKTASHHNVSRKSVFFELDIFPVNLRDIHHVNEHMVFVLSLMANAALITLLATERNKVLQAYSNVLIQNCVVDVVQAIVLFSAEFQMAFVDGRTITMVNNMFSKKLPMTFHYFCNFSCVWVCCTAICALPIVFYFRYQLIVRGRLLSRLELLKLLCFPTFFGMVHGMSLFIAVRSNDALRAEMCPRLLHHPIWHRPGTDISKCMFADDDNPVLKFYYFYAITLDIITYVIMTYCTVAVLRFMRKSKIKFSEKTRKMQRQMNVMLFAQMVIPLFSGILPVAVMMAVPFFRISIPGAGVVLLIAFSWMPFMNPLTTIFVVANFRRKAIRWVMYAPRLMMVKNYRISTVNSTQPEVINSTQAGERTVVV